MFADENMKRSNETGNPTYLSVLLSVSQQETEQIQIGMADQVTCKEKNLDY